MVLLAGAPENPVTGEMFADIYGNVFVWAGSYWRVVTEKNIEKFEIHESR